MKKLIARTSGILSLALLILVLVLSLQVAAVAGAAEAVPLTLEQAAQLALAQGPQQRDVQLSAQRAQAGLDLANSAFSWRVTAGTAKIPEIAGATTAFGQALSNLQVEQHGGEPDRSPISPAVTGLTYDSQYGQRWSVLPGITATKAFDNGGQLVLAGHLGVFGPLGGDSEQKDVESDLEPFAKVPLVVYSQPLLKNPSTLDSVLRRDDAERNAARESSAARLTQTKALLDVEQAYFAVAQAQDEVESAVRGLDAAHTEATVRQDKAWKNDATGLDLMESDVAVQRAGARVEAARHALAVANQRLNRLLGRPLSDPVSVQPPATAPAGTDTALDAAVSEALSARQELAIARSQVESAKAQLVAAEESAKAQISASAAVLGDKSWTIGLDAQWSLYDGGAAAARVAQSEAAVAQVEKAVADKEDDIRLQVTQAYYARQDADRAWQVAAANLDRAKKSAELTQERLKQGAAVTREATAADDAAFEAEVACRAALYRRYQAEWSWQAALGRLNSTVQAN